MSAPLPARSCSAASFNISDKRWLFGPFAVRGGVGLTLAAVANPVVAGGALVAYGTSTSTRMVASQSTLQTLVPADTRGRGFPIYDVL